MLYALLVAEIALIGIVVAVLVIVWRLVQTHTAALAAQSESWASVIRPPAPNGHDIDLEDRIRQALDSRLPAELPTDPPWLDTYDPDRPDERETAGRLAPNEPIHPDLPREDPPWEIT